MAEKKYQQYFDVDEAYFPCIDESAIRNGAAWDNTYPHETFIDLLGALNRMLGGRTKRSLWIHGAYGTGKSQCAHALKKILEVSNEEVRAYWEKYEPLKNKGALLDDLIGHKERGIIPVYRYSSSRITSPQLLCYAIQESVRAALDGIPGAYKGNATLRETAIKWLSQNKFKQLVDETLKEPEWRSSFKEGTADEIINSLSKGHPDTLEDTLNNLFAMAEKNGVTALSLTSDALCDWLRDIISKNNKKIVFVWDEFSDFFRNNKNSLGEFQKIVSLCQETHFYLVIVTHPISSLTGGAVSKNDPMSVVQQRFDRVEISLPPNIAFELIGHAFSVIPVAKEQWNILTDDLSRRLPGAKDAVMKATNIKSEKTMQDILPLHPMAALVLKNIAGAFQSNQRSMFDFIKSNSDTDVHAFQWFIANAGPESDRPFLTVDMLWDFFYEKGKDYLSSDIKLILDTFHQQKNINEDEKVILKTILVMIALDTRLGGAIPLLEPTEQNLGYAFQGDLQEYENNFHNIANGLVERGILTRLPVSKDKYAYAIAKVAGDGAKIERLRSEIRKNSTTAKLVSGNTELGAALSLSAALKLRCMVNADSGSVTVVTDSTFTKTVNELKENKTPWGLNVVLALAVSEDEAVKFRDRIMGSIQDETCGEIVIVDALSTPLGSRGLELYVENSALAQYFAGNDNAQSKEYSRKATDVLITEWKGRIQKGDFIVWSRFHKHGENAAGTSAVHKILETIIRNRFKYPFDFDKHITEPQLRLTQGKNSAFLGINGSNGKPVIGLMKGAVEHVLNNVWGQKDYWLNPSLEQEPISVIKRSLTEEMEKFLKTSGRISIEEIYGFLESNYGFTPCNLTALIIGFLLKEYSGEPYRSQDMVGASGVMTPDKLSEMIANHMKNLGKGGKTTYIVNLTEQERAFYELSEKAWGIEPNSCSNTTDASLKIKNKMGTLGYPVWCLEYVDSDNVYDVVRKYSELVRGDGETAHNVANELGKNYLERPAIAPALQKLLTTDNCREGMKLFLEKFEDGALLRLASEIGADERIVLSDISKRFSVENSSLWMKEVGEDEICKVIEEYEFIKISNKLLKTSDNTMSGVFKSWRDHFNFLGISCDAICRKFPAVNKLFQLLRKIAKKENLLPDDIKQITRGLEEHRDIVSDIFNDTTRVFARVFSTYLDGFGIEECEKVRGQLKDDMFLLPWTKSNEAVRNVALAYRNGQAKTRLYKAWNDATGTKNPAKWSEVYRTPILCCVDENLYDAAKKAFGILNSGSSAEADINFALNFIENNPDFFKKIQDSRYRDDSFMKCIAGGYSKFLPGIQEIRKELENLGVAAYDWIDSRKVKDEVKKLAYAEYNAGGSDTVVDIINNMDNEELRKWITDLAVDDLELGVKIINNGGR